MVAMNYRLRRQKFREALQDAKLDALLVTHAANIRYLCGFTGSAGVLEAGAGTWTFYTDGRYREQAEAQVQGARVVAARGAPLASMAARLSQTRRYTAIGIEADHLTVATRSALAGWLPRKMRLHETSAMVERLRMRKEPSEIDLIRRSVVLGASLLDAGVTAIHPGVRETEVAAEIEYAARRAGADGMSFDTIVASGPRSALPHGRASAHRIPRRGFVVMDFGVILDGYCSDMTRTVHVGRPARGMREIYEAVHEAQQAALDAVRPGAQIGNVDAAARRSLRRAGLASFFTHSTGHGVGLEIHEMPRIARGIEETLQPGMVITIEPGVYLPGRAGVRIEDMVAVTERGAELLTPVPKDWLPICC
jgi:Xaa-Pro aminopeptidase